MKILVIIGLVVTVILAGCAPSAPEYTPPKEYTQIIACNNLVLDCSYDDCSSQCASYASGQGYTFISGSPANNGKGCECKYK